MEVLIKEGDYINYLIKCNPDKDYRLEFEVWQVNSWSMDNEPLEYDQEIFVKGTIKWDGCSHIYFGDEDGYLHLCGHKYFEDMKKVLDAVWKKAEQEVTNFDKELAS
jgi:hypothetical protein